MKKHRLIALVILLVATIFTGCTKVQNTNKYKYKDTDKINVVATIFPQYDFVRQIAGDKVELTMLLSPGAESHSYEPTPQDIIKIQNCDIFIYVGGESDKWIDEILSSMDTSEMKIISLMDYVEVVEEEIIEGMEDDHDHGHNQDKDDSHHDDHDHNEEHEDEEHHENHVIEYDEHVWTSPKNTMKIVENITKILVQVDPDNQKVYKENLNKYIYKLEQLNMEFETIVSNASNKTIIFGDRFPFRYLTNEYGLDYYAAFPGCSTETEPSAATVSFLIDKVKSDKLPVVFHIEFSNEKIANVISESTGAKKLLLHSCHNISKTDFNNGTTYLDLMSQTAKQLKEALQ